MEGMPYTNAWLENILALTKNNFISKCFNKAN